MISTFSTPLPCGIPMMDAYNTVVTAEAFRDLKRYSDVFLRRNRAILDSHPRQWAPDPLHQWSRQWEYPFVFSHIDTSDQDIRRSFEILDAGSGITFFPYYLKQALPAAEIYCCGIDEALEPIFNRIEAPYDNAGISFCIQDTIATSYAEEKFDVDFCILVIEHMDNPGDILREFHRVLRPGDVLVLTLDISIDGRFDAPISAASKLLSETAELFSAAAGPISSLRSVDFNDGSALTTREAE